MVKWKFSALFLCFVFFFSAQAMAQIQGDGSESNPFQVSSASDLQEVMSDSSFWGSSVHLILTTDIDGTGMASPSPIGSNTSRFEGHFDGQGNTISHLTITSTDDCIGLFGAIGRGIVENINVTDSSFSGSNRVGGFVGFLWDGTIINCTTTADVIALQGSAGGFVGVMQNDGEIINCQAGGNVQGALDHVGGFVGNNDRSTIKDSSASGNAHTGRENVGGFCGFAENGAVIINCHASGNVSSDGGDRSLSGGFVGQVDYSTISECYSSGKATGDKSYVGGFVGWTDTGGRIYNSYATGDAEGQNNAVGGFAGGNMYLSSLIESCYSTGTATAHNGYAGGFVGYNDGPINKCYSTGGASATNQYSGGFVGYTSVDGDIRDCYSTGAAHGNDYVGGFFGYNEQGIVTHCYSTGVPSAVTANVAGFGGTSDAGSTYDCNFFDRDTSGFDVGIANANEADVVGLDTTAMKTESTYTGCNWDFARTWFIYEGTDYPSLFLADSYYILSVRKHGSGSGLIQSAPGGIDCGNECNAVYQSGAVVDLTVTSAGGSWFDGFSGDLDSTSETVSITMDANKTIQADFSRSSGSSGGGCFMKAIMEQ